jgi:glycosyltransferase involved in cell wall biosynthesis
MKKNILMLLPNGFDPDPRVYNEAKSLIDAGYHVTILCWDRDVKYKKEEVIDGIHIERIFVRSSYGRGTSQLGCLWKFWKQAYQRALKLAPDVVHAHDFNTLPLGYWLGRKLKIPVIFDAHESYHEMMADNVHPLIKWIIARAERYLVKRIDLLITVGSILEEEYKRRGSKRTVVIGNWKRLDEFHFSEAEIRDVRRELGIPENRLIISYVGYFCSSRGLRALIEAVRSDKKVFLIIGGKGKLEDEISGASKDTENILYLGYTTPERVPLITALSDVIYYGLEDCSGNNKYSAPNKLYEALAAGRAVLTSNIGEIARIVREENCGISLENISKENVLNAFKKLRNHSILTEYKSNARLAGINKYNWSNAEETLLNVYEKTLCF